MFKNYQELFNGYAELYKESFFSSFAGSLEEERYTFKAINNSDHDYNVLGSTQQPNSQVLSKFYVLLNHLTQPNEFQTSITPAIGSKYINEDGEVITIGSFNGLQVADFAFTLAIFCVLILAKRFLSAKLKSSKYLDKLQLLSKDRERLDECLWRLVFYTFSSTWLIYTCFLKHQAQLYFNPDQTIAEYSFDVGADEYGIIVIEVAFYLHATYAILCEDVVRKDSIMMFIHHLAAIFGVMSFYATRTHRVGLATVVLRDTCDVLLELTKLAMCLRIQRGKLVKPIEQSIKLFFIVFTIAFTVNQLYYYPLFCLYHGFNIMKTFHVKSSLYTGILSCGLIFLLLDLLWFLVSRSCRERFRF